MDALLQRQRNLIELFGKEDELLNAVEDGEESVLARRLAQGANGGSHMSSLSRESATVGEWGRVVWGGNEPMTYEVGVGSGVGPGDVVYY